ncbi:exported protein of unknown function [Streptomyces murinus]
MITSALFSPVASTRSSTARAAGGTSVTEYRTLLGCSPLADAIHTPLFPVLTNLILVLAMHPNRIGAVRRCIQHVTVWCVYAPDSCYLASIGPTRGPKERRVLVHHQIGHLGLLNR